MCTTCGGCGGARPVRPPAPRGIGGVKTGGCKSAERPHRAPGDDRAGRQAIALSSEPSGQVQTGVGGKTISFSIYVQYTNGEHDLPLNRHANMCYSSVETERTVYKASGRVQRATPRAPSVIQHGASSHGLLVEHRSAAARRAWARGLTPRTPPTHRRPGPGRASFLRGRAR